MPTLVESGRVPKTRVDLVFYPLCHPRTFRLEQICGILVLPGLLLYFFTILLFLWWKVQDPGRLHRVLETFLDKIVVWVREPIDEDLLIAIRGKEVFVVEYTLHGCHHIVLELRGRDHHLDIHLADEFGYVRPRAQFVDALWIDGQIEQPFGGSRGPSFAEDYEPQCLARVVFGMLRLVEIHISHFLRDFTLLSFLVGRIMLDFSRVIIFIFITAWQA